MPKRKPTIKKEDKKKNLSKNYAKFKTKNYAKFKTLLVKSTKAIEI